MPFVLIFLRIPYIIKKIMCVLSYIFLDIDSIAR